MERLLETIPEEYFQHQMHEHPLRVLSLVGMEVDEDHEYPKCCVCEEDCTDDVYFCIPCGLIVHKPCLELLQKFKLSLPSNASVYLAYGDSNRNCLFCENYSHGRAYLRILDIQNQFGKRTEIVDMKCALDIIKSMDICKPINHFLHGHPLVSTDKGSRRSWHCKLCREEIHRLRYLCLVCYDWHLHISCSEIPRVINYPQHSQHPLSIHVAESTNEGSKRTCNTCEGTIFDNIYMKCDEEECKFYLHVGCSYLIPSIKWHGHEHLLTIIESKNYLKHCDACSHPCDNFHARCVECDINFHIQCGPGSHLPPSVTNECHSHPLTLSYSGLSWITCDACKKEIFEYRPMYRCQNCDYATHVRCVISEVKLEEREKLEHFSHRHYLFLNAKGVEDVSCSVCMKNTQEEIYGCSECKFIIHKSCAEEIPTEIQHPFRPGSTLTLHYSTTSCNACQYYSSGLFYIRDNNRTSSLEDFNLDVECAFRQPSIKFKGHEQHLLTFFEKVHRKPFCEVCSSIYEDSSFYLRCVGCDFNVHLLCAPLPQTIKHDHIHRLTLVDYITEDDSYFWDICDICNEERNPYQCIYYCAECKYVAEIKCLISEVVRALKEESEDVPLRAVDRKAAREEIKKHLTLEGIMEAAGKEFERLFEDVNSEINSILSSVALSKATPGDFLNDLSYSGKAFVQLIKPGITRWNGGGFGQLLNVIQDSEMLKSEVVKVENYKTISEFASTLSNLLAKYGDIGAESSLSERGKAITMAFLCGTLCSMGGTKIFAIAPLQIFSWWYCSLTVKHAGFRVDFLFEHLMKIASSQFVVYNKAVMDPILHGYTSEIEELSQKIESLTKKLEEQKQEQRNHIMSTSFSISDIDKEQLSQALQLRLKAADAGLL